MLVKVDDFYADVPCANFVADVEVCKPVLKECKCDGKVNESNHLLSEFCSAYSEDFEKRVPVKRPVSIGVLKDGFKDANESKKERMCSDRGCLSETQGESRRSYGIRNKVSFSNSELGDFISSNVDGEIARYGDEDEIKNSFCDENDVNDISGESIDPFRVYMEFDLENRIQKLEKRFSKLKEARFGQKVETV
ncbi:hypothetical protein MtrunA17_Chr5g0427011 [Medicago truncatula]|uniref:Uncharacterized protein n=1 Tax=Medicago truncatula TaxID=3880 RepID=A0A396HS87_MEDTR|nr:hypothetical protein MtrunA17_Chr5g0427011 [Medicago truncatula]